MMEEQNIMVFCTLFDANYLDRGLALYHSLVKNVGRFKLYIFAFDEDCCQVLKSIKLKNAIIVPLSDIMNEQLCVIQKERTRAEFCWTCTPLIIQHVFFKYAEKLCTYIDADIYFYASPLHMIQEFLNSGSSVGLVAHHFERDCEYGSQVFFVGKYCIQFNVFVNNKSGNEVLEDWKADCLEWCYSRFEDGKFGDQKYPDTWKMKYSCIYEFENLGAGVAPWNLHLYTYLGKKDGKIWLKYQNQFFYIIFYHFEGMKYLKNKKVYLNIWKPATKGIGRKRKELYDKYLKVILTIREFLFKKYNITFEKMVCESDLFIEKSNSLRQFCNRDGLMNGVRAWTEFRKNNIYSIKRQSEERVRRYVFAGKD